MQEITVSELKQMIDDNEDFQLIDVREPHEHEMSNIKGELIPLATVINSPDRINSDKKVVLHCRSGVRSAAAISQLEKNFNIPNLYNLKGGILAWKEEIDPSIESV